MRTLLTDCSTPSPLRGLGVYDPLTARIAERAGADFLWLSSFSYSAAQGYPDLGLLSFASEVPCVTRIRRMTTIPLVVDLDNALGGPCHASELACTLQGLGVEAISIEDKASPKYSSLYDQCHQLMDTETFVTMLRAIKVAAPKLVLLARLEGLVVGVDLHEVQNRIEAVLEAGADLVLLHNTSTDSATLKHLIEVNPEALFALVPTTYMKELRTVCLPNVRLLIFSNQILRAAFRHLAETADILVHSPESLELDLPSSSNLDSFLGAR